MSLKAANPTKGSKQPQPAEKAFGNYTKLPQKVLNKPSFQLSAHKRTRSDIPQFNNFMKPASSVFQLNKQSAQKKVQQSGSKSPITPRKGTLTPPTYSRENSSAKKPGLKNDISPQKNYSAVNKPKNPLVVRQDNSLGQITQRVLSDPKSSVPSCHSSIKARSSIGDIYPEKEKKDDGTRKDNSQIGLGPEPDLSKRSSATNFSPPIHWNSRVTSKKPSVCDFSQVVNDLHKECDVSNERKNKGSISSRPSFEMYKEYIHRNLFSQNNSPFALYSEFSKPKKEAVQPNSASKSKFIDSRVLDNSPLSIENRYLNKERIGPKGTSKQIQTNVSLHVINKTKSPTKKLDYSLENSLLEPVYQKLQQNKAKVQDPKSKQENEYSYKTPSKASDKTTSNASHILTTHMNATNITQDKNSVNITVPSQDKDKKTPHPLLSGLHYRLFEHEKPSKFYIDEPSEKSIPFLKPPKLANTSMESIHADISVGEPSIYDKLKRDCNISARRGTQDSIVDFENVVFHPSWSGLQVNKDLNSKPREINHKGSVGNIEAYGAFKIGDYSSDMAYFHQDLKHATKSNNFMMEGENMLPRSSRMHLEKTPRRNEVVKPQGDRIDEVFSSATYLKEPTQRRNSKNLIEDKCNYSNLGFERGPSKNNVSKDLKIDSEAQENTSKPAHKKNSKSWNSVNALEQIIKGLNLPISMPKANEGDNLTPNISEFKNSDNMNMLGLDRQEALNDHDYSKHREISVSNMEQDERSDDEYLKEKLIKMLKETFKTKSSYPSTTLDFYRLVKMIGKGAFGKVFLGVHLLTGKHVAIKSIEKKYIKEESSQKKIFQEVLILKKMNNQKVIRLLEVFENKRYLFLVLEYASKGDLLKYVKKKGRLSEDTAREIFVQIVAGLRYCHRNMVLHRDIKLDNVLLDEHKNVKICDFGVSRFVKKGQIIKEQCGTPAYIAPEIIRDKGYEGCYADIWSLGVVLYAMVTGTVPFKADNIEDLHKVILKGKYSTPNFLSEDCKDLLSKMLKVNPYSRISIETIDEHSWFDKGDILGRRESICTGLTDMSQLFTLDNRRAYSVDKGCKRASLSKADNENTVQIVDAVLEQVEKLGFSREFTVQSMNSNSCNHASASYFLLYEDYIRKTAKS